jgi:hypothetical protein
MSTEQDPIVDSLKAAGIAVGTTALTGVAISMFGRKERNQEKVQRSLDERVTALEMKAGETLSQLGEVVSDLRTMSAKEGKAARAGSASLSRKASRKADRAVAAVLTKAQELEQEARRIGVVERANALGSDASNQANEALAAFKVRTIDLLAEGKRIAPDWKNAAATAAVEARGRSESLTGQVPDVKNQLNKVAQELALQAKGRAPELQEKGQHLIDRAKVLAVDLASQAKDKAPEAQAKATALVAAAGAEADRLTTHVKDRSALEQCAHQIVGLLAEAQKNATPVVKDATQSATHVIETAKHATEQMLPEAKERVAHLGETLSTTGHAPANLQALGSAATHKLADTTDLVQVKSSQAATAAGRGTKELGAVIGWGTALGGIVYVAFLKPHQRERVKQSAARVASEALSVVQDIRGQNGQF